MTKKETTQQPDWEKTKTITLVNELIARGILDGNHLKMVSNELRQREDEAYARGWTQRDNDYQAIGEKPPEQEAAKRAVEEFSELLIRQFQLHKDIQFTGKQVVTEIKDMCDGVAELRQKFEEIVTKHGEFSAKSISVAKVRRLLASYQKPEDYLGALPPIPELSEQEQKARLKRAGKAAKKLKEIEEANET